MNRLVINPDKNSKQQHTEPALCRTTLTLTHANSSLQLYFTGKWGVHVTKCMSVCVSFIGLYFKTKLQICGVCYAHGWISDKVNLVHDLKMLNLFMIIADLWVTVSKAIKPNALCTCVFVCIMTEISSWFFLSDLLKKVNFPLLV